ncbi:8-amino-7-oxononanoate synthase domain protein [Mycobacterium ulcerans str. Harvey]|uniref:8-amino-7-oxononanoate synthase domain protein n=1 Tax=Mycobacterium ulcerans str. Harvey TaxID=1299332 RepID=A0ABN0R902_MYCUL|nr:8-amino-7-oxononanoate synthase domain protein [Mycobacterium ulcerans str. Harvey]
MIADFNRVYAFYDELMRNGIRVFPITYPAYPRMRPAFGSSSM